MAAAVACGSNNNSKKASEKAQEATEQAAQTISDAVEEEIHGDYYLWHEFHFHVDEKWSFEETMKTLKKTLIEKELL